MRKVGLTALVALAAVGVLMLLAARGNAAQPEGSVRFFKKADTPMDRYNTSATWQPTINSRYAGMLMYPPYSDRFTFYTGEGFFYLDALAVYTDSGQSDAGATTAQILRNSSGQPCYIPWGGPTGGHPYPQYAADVGNATFRSLTVDYIKATLLNPLYDVVYLDDVNLDLETVSCSGGPIDPRTGQVMTNENWKRYFVEYLEQIRAAVPTEKVAHNTVWYQPAFNDPYLLREIRAADYIEMEQGFVDRGLTGGTGTFSWLRKMQFVDLVHSLGRTLIDHDIDTSSDVERDYGLANYFLLNNGNDYYSSFWKAFPDSNPWAYGLNLGAALGPRYQTGSSWRRDFERGYVVVNPPPVRTASIVVAAGSPGASPTATPTPAPTVTSTPLASPTSTPSPTAAPTPTPAPQRQCQQQTRWRFPGGVWHLSGWTTIDCRLLFP
jgi:Hypothetical glycosyl hydrolase family 15